MSLSAARDELIESKAMRFPNLDSRRLATRGKLAMAMLLLGGLALPQTVISQSSNIKQSDRLITHPETVKILPSQNKRWALLIGVDRYEDSNISSLRGAGNDVRSLREVLVNHAGFPQDQVIVLSSDEPTERQPTRRNILRRLSNLSGLVPKDGLLLVSFAGHGIDRNGQGFLIPSDATFTEDVSLLEETAISVNGIKQRIKDTGVQQVMILLDACRSYPTGRSDTSNPLTPGFTSALKFDVRNREVTAFAILYATEVGRRAYEYGEKHQGYFTWAITQALKGAAANERGEITLGGLIKYLENTVPKLVAIDYGAKVIQKPFADIEGYRADELVLSTASTNNRLSQTDAAKDTVRSNDQVRVAPPTVTRLSVKGSKSQKVIYSHGILANTNGVEFNELVGILDEFNLVLVSSLEKAELTVIRREQLSERDLDQLTGITRVISDTQVPQSKSLPAAVFVKVTLSIKDLPAYRDLYISVTHATVTLFDLDEGKTIAVEDLGQKKGFGNTQEQARRNSLREAALSVPGAFIVKVRDQAW